VTYTGSGEADYAAGSGGVPLVRHYLSDHLGSVRNVVDVDSEEIVRQDYDPYGVREKIFAATGAMGYEAGRKVLRTIERKLSLGESKERLRGQPA
jgi:hypothetical protein